MATILDTSSSLYSSPNKMIASVISVDEGAPPPPRNSIVPPKTTSVPDTSCNRRIFCLRFLTGSSVIEVCSFGMKSII